MVRVAGLKRRLQTGLPVRGGDRLTPREQLELIAERTADLVARHAACFVDEVLPKLAAEGIELVRWADLDAAERERLRTLLPGADLPGADAAGRRPGAPVPVHLRPVAQPGRRGARPGRRPGAVRPGQGAQQRAAVRHACDRTTSRGVRGSCRWRS